MVNVEPGFSKSSQKAPALGELALQQQTTVDAIGKRLVQGPIHNRRYGSEADFICAFSKVARKIASPDCTGTFSAETQLLGFLAQWFQHNRRLVKNPYYFDKNMAILSKDLYLVSSVIQGATGQRLPLAELMASFGTTSVMTYAELGRNGLGLHFPDESTAKEAPRGRWLSRLLTGELRQTVKEALEFICLRDLSVLIFPSISERWARSAAHRQRLTDFYDRLVMTNERFEILQHPPSMWKLALQVNGESASDASEMLGGIVGQATAPLRFVEEKIIPRYPEAAGADAAFANGAKAWYTLPLLHEKSLLRFGQGVLYPDEVAISNAKFWHFYAASMLAERLRAHPTAAVRCGGFLLASGYEAATLLVNISLTPYGGWVRRLMMSLVSSVKDVRTQVHGNSFGLSRAKAGTHNPVKATEHVFGGHSTRSPSR